MGMARWTGGYRQEGWAEARNINEVIPFFELSLFFGVLVYLWETYLDWRCGV